MKKILGPLLTTLASDASAPDKNEVFKSLSKLLDSLRKTDSDRGLILQSDFLNEKFIVFSDHHKGNKDAGDDFASNEKNYLAALDYYFTEKFIYINLGDSEELWKYKPAEVISKNMTALRSEARFHKEKRYYKTFGNHDLTWKDKLEVRKWFKDIFDLPLPVLEGIVLKTTVGEKPLSVFFDARTPG